MPSAGATSSLIRLLLDPDPAGNATGGAQAAGGQQTAEGQPTQTIQITSAEYQRLVAAGAERDTLSAQRENDRRAAEEARLREVARAEGAEAALTQQRETWARDLETERQRGRDVETRWHKAEKERAIAGQLAGVPFVNTDAAAQVRSLLDGRFETRTDATGDIVVQEVGTGRPAADVIKEALASPAFAHHLKPKAGGGTGAQTPTPNPFAGGSGELTIQELNQRGYEMAARQQLSPDPFALAGFGRRN